MVYIFDRLDQYTDEAYEVHLSSLPSWRREKALQYKKLDDRKRSVLAFALLQCALREEYGVTEVPEFVYNEFGKPSFSNLPIRFSLSHCRDAVACAVSDYNIGIDVETIVPYNPDVARRVCTAVELEMLGQSENKDADFIKLWTIKEAISKYEGMGVSLPFADIDAKKYSTYSKTSSVNTFVLSVCFGEASNEYNGHDEIDKVINMCSIL